jgi:hypothetical protein
MPDDKEPTGSNYRGNSYTGKAKKADAAAPEKPKLEQVTDSPAIERKKGLGTKIKETFTGDSMDSVIHYVATEIIVPAIKTLISDMMSQGTERLLFGGAAPRSGRRPGYTSYNKMSSNGGSQSARPQMSQRGRATHDFREIILPERGDAEMVLDNLGAQIDEYGMATVEDLYSLVGITGNFQDSQWGWTDLRGSGVKRVREGYLLELPRTTSLD